MVYYSYLTLLRLLVDNSSTGYSHKGPCISPLTKSGVRFWFDLLSSGSDLEVHDDLKFAQTHHWTKRIWSCAPEHKQPVLDLNGVITVLGKFSSWDQAQPKGAGNLVYHSTIFQGLFAPFLFIDQSEHRKCEWLDSYCEGGML
uniref:Uncharacterized protein n=1 Tax=Hyaloperonospora arabidopsidis (strain Emoy2) TaxID=559515 RepID=M4B3A4_HYAAE